MLFFFSTEKWSQSLKNASEKFHHYTVYQPHTQIRYSRGLNLPSGVTLQYMARRPPVRIMSLLLHNCDSASYEVQCKYLICNPQTGHNPQAEDHCSPGRRTKRKLNILIEAIVGNANFLGDIGVLQIY